MTGAKTIPPRPDPEQATPTASPSFLNKMLQEIPKKSCVFSIFLVTKKKFSEPNNLISEMLGPRKNAMKVVPNGAYSPIAFQSHTVR